MRKEEAKEYFWQMQGLTSFCKAKGNWLPYDKIHLSFVKHEGRDKGCKQVLAIEGALKVHGSDGALYLSELVLSGAAKKLAEKSRANPGNNGYLSPIFTSMGGTVASRSQDGKCVFRQFSVAPGMKSDFVFSMMTCDGEETKTGGIQPVKGAKRESINVSLSSADLVDFAASVKAEYAAYRTSMMLQPQEQPSQASPAAHPSQAAPAPQSAPQPSAPEPAGQKIEGVPLVIMYEHSGMLNSGLPFATTIAGAPALLGKLVRAVQKAPQSYALDNEKTVEQAKALIAKAEKGNCMIAFTGKGGERTALVIVVDTVK